LSLNDLTILFRIQPTHLPRTELESTRFKTRAATNPTSW